VVQVEHKRQVDRVEEVQDKRVTVLPDHRQVKVAMEVARTRTEEEEVEVDMEEVEAAHKREMVQMRVRVVVDRLLHLLLLLAQQVVRMEHQWVHQMTIIIQLWMERVERMWMEIQVKSWLFGKSIFVWVAHVKMAAPAPTQPSVVIPARVLPDFLGYNAKPILMNVDPIPVKTEARVWTLSIHFHAHVQPVSVEHFVKPTSMSAPPIHVVLLAICNAWIKSMDLYVNATRVTVARCVKRKPMNVDPHLVKMVAYVPILSMDSFVHVPLAIQDCCVRPISMNAARFHVETVVFVMILSMDSFAPVLLAIPDYCVKPISVNVCPRLAVTAACVMM
jgi:hypothetical protein